MTNAASRAPIFARWLGATANIEPHEMRAAVLSFLYFFFLLGSYYILRPVRDAMGTVYGSDQLEKLYTYTFLATLVAAPIYGAVASRLKLSTLLPWVYGFFVVNILMFYGLFQSGLEDRSVAAIFFVWVSVFNMFITSVFWSFMADVFSKTQAKRLFGVIAAGGSFGAAAGPAITALLVSSIGTNNLLLISAAGFTLVVVIVILLEKEKARLGSLVEEDVQHTTMSRRLQGGAADGFFLLMKSPYLLLIAAFILMLTWISTVLYFQQADLVSRAFETREARTQAFAVVDLVVNVGAIFVQIFGTSRLISRFGITSALTLVPVIMVVSFIAIALSPAVLVLLGVQAVRRIAEYAVARPGREMLFTVVDQESKYKAKNVIDTVVYRFGDLSAAWIIAALSAVGLTASGLAIFGVAASMVWGAIALKLGRRYESVSVNDNATTAPARSALQV